MLAHLDSLAVSDDDVGYVVSTCRLLCALFRLISFAVVSCKWRRLWWTSGDKAVVTTLVFDNDRMS